MKNSKQNQASIRIRPAEVNDTHAIATIHVAAWQNIYRNHIPDVVLDNLSVANREQQWQVLLSKGVKVFVIDKNKQIVGFVSLCKARDKDCPKFYGEISAIYLHPSVWHQGLGKKLCSVALNELKNMGFSDVILWVLAENKQARRFYEALGFSNMGNAKIEVLNANSFILQKPIKSKQSVKLKEIRYHKELISIRFKPLKEEHLDLLCTWLNAPHVKAWWNDYLNNEEIKTKYRERIGDNVVVPFIVYADDTPIGFIQYYHADQVGEGWWPDETAGTLGIDLFIGEKEFTNRGLGVKVIRSFVKKCFANPTIKKIIIDVDPKNLRALHCYEKAGFKFSKEILTPDGLANLMELPRESK